MNDHVRTVTTIPVGLTKARPRIIRQQLMFFLVSASSILLSMLASVLVSVLASFGVWFPIISSHSIEEEPQTDVYLAGIILSSLVGISIIFLLARKIYQSRERERSEAIKRVRIKESQLFTTLERDFERIIKPSEVHGG